ncbi:unnamed protein product [Anisakis simplex]|uniref:DNA-directed DNA polymerase n=1 Tax=Anisakis simplex TaxID=6269 RepID=A0A0M3JCK3_ANISI|nr:unnamed protein product [Anisakis simplex]
MLAPSWMQIVDDVDIISAVEHLKGIGLLVPKERYSKCKKQSFDAYQKADFRAVRDVDQLLLPYGLQLSDVVNVQ